MFGFTMEYLLEVVAGTGKCSTHTCRHHSLTCPDLTQGIRLKKCREELDLSVRNYDARPHTHSAQASNSGSARIGRSAPIPIASNEGTPLLASSQSPHQRSNGADADSRLVTSQYRAICAVPVPQLSYGYLCDIENERLKSKNGQAPTVTSDPVQTGTKHCSIFGPAGAAKSDEFVGVGRHRHPKCASTSWIADKLAQELSDPNNLYYTERMDKMLGAHPLVAQNPDKLILADINLSTKKRELAGPSLESTTSSEASTTVDEAGCIIQRGFELPLATVPEAEALIDERRDSGSSSNTQLRKSSTSFAFPRFDQTCADDLEDIDSSDRQEASERAHVPEMYRKRPTPPHQRNGSALTDAIRGPTAPGMRRTQSERAGKVVRFEGSADNKSRPNSDPEQRKIFHVSKEEAEEAISSETEDEKEEDVEEMRKKMQETRQRRMKQQLQQTQQASHKPSSPAKPDVVHIEHALNSDDERNEQSSDFTTESDEQESDAQQPAICQRGEPRSKGDPFAYMGRTPAIPIVGSHHRCPEQPRRERPARFQRPQLVPKYRKPWQAMMHKPQVSRLGASVCIRN